MRHVIMVRHGQARNNVERTLAGRMDGVPLTPDGVRQAGHAAKMLASAGVSAIYSSPIERAAETARMISEECGVPVTVDERLTEIDMGKFTGMTFEEVVSGHDDIFAKFYGGDVEIAHKGVETFEQVRRRVTGIVSEVASGGGDAAAAGSGGGASDNDNGNAVLVTHMDPIKAMLGEIAGISPERLLRAEIANAALNVFRREPDGGLSLLALNVMDASRFAA
ncbi:MAG: histidine phosphatase family protein [Thaumarchaeota archaeon]|nr:histidine phosphatase family protein [Nitrososphaerota archaeon]MDE0266263.1 histidine phosphatase family protein [Nitrososphaerota archaeon]MDE0524993.1 histidine phosphatase family protein [Nitrososphaerota archaeon]